MLYTAIILLFGFIIPFFSVDFEIQKVTNHTRETESFTLLYTYLRFPMWWIFGILEILILKYQIKK